MPGIYIHIPFCKQACHYCDFHFSTTLKNKEELLTAIKLEISLRRPYLENKFVDTIYFGGGTPSILEGIEIREIMAEIRDNFEIVRSPEITLEANPDDLDLEKLQQLKDAGINRLSIGIQSFSEEDLKFMNRAHTVEQAHQCVKDAQKVGIKNISIDLIYGVQSLDDTQWNKNLDLAFAMGVQHLSCYSLTVESRTALAKMIKSKAVTDVDDEKSARHFEILMDKASKAGFEHYEISNFALPGFRSKHNTSYWQGEIYLGVGPSAHSYNISSRQWNISNNHEYIRKMMQGTVPAEVEILSTENKYNEYILTRLRTSTGIDPELIKKEFGKEQSMTFLAIADFQIQDDMMERAGSHYRLTHKGKFYADRIAADFFTELEE
ncbi:MAG TPA: radical SAM family heme chaperone HemW [Bacteroidia bacterium]|nr:radical SAM family heme chaperone HemW [Bacteroidia bacterium]HNS11426.1 radical SAM family heme chaperone HemW [Bacteroidia bacterium]